MKYNSTFTRLSHHFKGQKLHSEAVVAILIIALYIRRTLSKNSTNQPRFNKKQLEPLLELNHLGWQISEKLRFPPLSLSHSSLQKGVEKPKQSESALAGWWACWGGKGFCCPGGGLCSNGILALLCQTRQFVSKWQMSWFASEVPERLARELRWNFPKQGTSPETISQLCGPAPHAGVWE